MQNMFVIVDILSNVDIEGELTLFLCSVIAFFVLVGFRNKKAKKGAKPFKHVQLIANQEPTIECDGGTHDDARYVQTDKALRTAFEKEDYWQVLKCWNELKYFHQSSIHLSMVIRSMRFCNKGAYFIVGELKNFFKAHPQMRSIGLINDLLEPLARRAGEDAQLVDLLVRMIPSINLVKDSRTYEILLTMHTASGNLAKAQEIMAEMKTKQVPFSPCTHVAIMTLGLQMGDIDAVLEAFDKLKASWDERETWAVSMFALKSHKTNILLQIVTLACQKQQVCELSTALEGMRIPEEVLEAAQTQFSRMSDVDFATTIAVLEKSGENLKTDVFYDALVGCSRSRSVTRSLTPWRAPKSMHTDLDASTSEGSRSDSEEESCLPTKTLPPWRSNARIYRQKVDHTDSSASTSEGSRSDSEEEPNFGPCFAPPPGLAPPLVF